MTTRRRIFGIKSMREFGLQLPKPVVSLLAQAREATAAKRLHQVHFRPCLEQLEDRITPSGYTLTTLASFNGADGDGPVAGLIMDASGNLYGTTPLGGSSGDGNVFELAHGSSMITPLASFNGADGDGPVAGLIMDASGNLYGTAGNGADSDGNVFELAHGSSMITPLASFNGADGAAPAAGLIMDASGNLYGTTLAGGSYRLGTVFELAHGSSMITPLASFNGADGDAPEAGLIMDASGNLYGTTVNGGSSYQSVGDPGLGTVFELALANGISAITRLASFNGTNGAGPFGGSLIMDGSGNLYGTADVGGASNDGTVFELARGSSTITTLASFNGTNGARPYAGLVMDASGNLYGTTAYGGSSGDDNISGDGTVFELARGSSTITTLASFNGTNGASPYAGLVMDASGNLYGTTPGGGASNDGTVFEVSNLTPSSASVSPTLSWDSAGGIDEGYMVSGTTPQATNVDLFWASGNQYADAIGGPIAGASQAVAAGTTPGSYGPFNIDDSTLGTPPPGATYLLAVADPNNVLGTFNPNTNVAAIAVPTWTGAGATDLWSDGNNWLAGVAPTAGSDLIFPSSALQETSVNDLGFTFGSIITSDAYSFSGQPFTANSITVSQGSLELDSPTTVTDTLSVAANTTLIVGSGTATGSLTVPANAALSLDGRLIVNAMATLEDDGTLTISSEGVLDDFGEVNVGEGGTLTGSQGLLLVAPNAILSNSGTLDVSNDASLADEGTITVINSGTLTNSGAMSVGNSDSLIISNGSMTETPGAAMDVEGNVTDDSGSPLTIEGYLDLDGIDDGLDMPGDAILVSTPVTSTTPTSTRAEEIAAQVAAIDALPFETIKILAEDSANQSAGDIVVIQGAEKLASWADKAHYFGLTTEYSSDISAILKAYNNNDPDTFAVKYSKLVRDMVGDLANATGAAPFKAQSFGCDGLRAALSAPLNALIFGFANQLEAENYYDNHLAAGVTADGFTIYNALKTRSSTAGPGVGGTLTDQGSLTVSPTGTLSDQDAITVAAGATLSVFGNLTEGATGAQQVFGTLVVEPAGILDIIGSLTIEPGGSFVPLGTISVAPGGIANLPSGVSAFGTNLFIVGGATTNDLVQVNPVGTSQTGSTGLQVNGLLNGMAISTTFSQPFSSIYIFGYAANENVILAGGLAINAFITAGNGNDNVIAGDSNNSITLGDGNDNVIVGNGNNTVTLGDGNDNVIAGNGNNAVTLGNGNDNMLVGNGNNVLVEGNGHDNIIAGNGDNLIVAGQGQHSVLVGNGSNILIDGSVQLTQIGDSLTQVLTDWITYGATPTNLASIRSRLAVTYNSSRHNTLIAGTGLDWFFATYAGDIINRKPTDLLN